MVQGLTDNLKEIELDKEESEKQPLPVPITQSEQVSFDFPSSESLNNSFPYDEKLLGDIFNISESMPAQTETKVEVIDVCK